VCVCVFVRVCVLGIEVRSQNEGMSDLKNAKKIGGQKGPLKYHRPEEDKIRGTLVQLLWRAAAPGLKPLRLPRTQSEEFWRRSKSNWRTRFGPFFHYW